MYVRGPNSDLNLVLLTNIVIIFVSVFVSTLVSPSSAEAAGRIRANYTGKSWHRIMAYTDKERSAGQDHWFLFEQRFDFSKSLSLKAQGYLYAGDSKANLAQAFDRVTIQNEATEFWPGEVFGQFASGPLMFRLGFQRVFWQEGFGISYTNFLNARDSRVSVFDDSELIFRSAPMANMILSGDNLSFQAIYLPFAPTDISPPASRLGARAQIATPVFAPVVEIERTPQFKSASDYGGRVTWAGEGFDISVFAAHLIDRAGSFALSPNSNFGAVILTPELNAIDPMGVTTSIEIQDFIARLEFMRIPERRVNRINGLALASSVFQEDAMTIGLDSPAWPSIMFSLQHSVSILNEDVVGLVRNRIESLSFASVNYTFNSDRVLRLALVYLESDQSMLGRLSLKWPMSARSEIETFYEGSTGSGSSRGMALSNLNRFSVQVNFTL